MANENITVVNRTTANLALLGAEFWDSICYGIIPNGFEDMFTVTTLAGFNNDGSDRHLLDWA